MKKQTAEERASELMMVKIRDLPPLAYSFMKKLSSEIGYCGEVCLTAFCAYAQAVEGLKCTDRAYKLSSADAEWFKEELTKYGDVFHNMTVGR